MTVAELITKEKIREKIFDTLSVTYTDGEICSYVNDALNLIWNQLGSIGYYELIKETTFAQETGALPSDYLRFIGKYPIRMKSDGTYQIYGTVPMSVRYIKKPAFVVDATSPLPFTNDSLNLLVGQIAVMFALNRNEYSVEFEKMIIDEIRKSIG